MIPVLLVDELCTFLKGVVVNYTFSTTKQTEKVPQVVPGYLPPKENDEFETEPDFPYIIVRIIDGESAEESSDVNVKILVGCYAEDAQGWRDVCNAMERIRQALFKQRVISRKYRIEYPVKWELPEEQPYPHWVGAMNTKWTVASPIEEVILPNEYYKD